MLNKGAGSVMKARVSKTNVVKVFDVDQLARLCIIERYTQPEPKSKVLVSEIARCLGRTDSTFLNRLLEDNEDLLLEGKYILVQNLNKVRMTYRSKKVKDAWAALLLKMAEYLSILKKLLSAQDKLWSTFYELREAQNRAVLVYDDSAVRTLFTEAYNNAVREQKRNYSHMTMYLMYFPEARAVLTSPEDDAYDDFLYDMD